MGEPIWTTVKVKYPKRWHNTETMFSSELEALADYLGEGDVDDDIGPDYVIVGWQGEANYGFAADTVGEAFEYLIEQRIPFVAWSEPKYEFDGEWVLFNAGNERNEDSVLFTGLCSEGGQMLLNESTLEAIMAGRHEWAQTPHDYFHPPTLDEMSISHLQDQPRPIRDRDKED